MVAPARWKITRSSSSVSRRSNRARFVGTAAVAGAAVGAAVFVAERRSRLNASSSSSSPQKLKRKPFKISPIVADALAGAAGEIAQLSSLYPLDTVKVVQQAADCSLGGALRLLAPAGARPAAVLAAFYRGCLPACVASAAVGAVYLVSFSGAQRAWERAAVRGGRGGGGGDNSQASAAAAAASSSSSSSSSSISSSDGDEAGSLLSAPFASLTVSAAVVASAEGHHSSSSSPQISSSSSISAHSHHLPTVPAHVQAEAATAGAVVASVATSLMEAPLELFRHRAQAVVVGAGASGAAASAAAAGASGSVLAQASAAFAAGGVKELYRGLAPYVLKSAPYDISELLVYSMLRGRGNGGGANGNSSGGGAEGGERSSSTSSDGSVGGVFSLLPASMRPPPQLAHAVLGAVAGAAAVVASMPADCIKLKLELSSAPVAHGLTESVGQFFGTGRSIAAGPGGPAALFRGMGPRLAEKVPSTMIYWVVVEAARKALAPHVYRGEEGEEESEAEAVLAAVLPSMAAKKEQQQKRKSFFRRSSSSSSPSCAASSSGDFVVV